MSKESVKSDQGTETPQRTGELRTALKTFIARKIVIFGLIIILITIMTAILAPIIAHSSLNFFSLLIG